jgi:hypothetical protein
MATTEVTQELSEQAQLNATKLRKAQELKSIANLAYRVCSLVVG